jgi:hypothetical protein
MRLMVLTVMGLIAGLGLAAAIVSVPVTAEKGSLRATLVAHLGGAQEQLCPRVETGAIETSSKATIHLGISGEKGSTVAHLQEQAATTPTNTTTVPQATTTFQSTTQATTTSPQATTPQTTTVPQASPSQQNLDGDVQGNACDADIDGDGRLNATDYDPYNPSAQDLPSSSDDCTITIGNTSDVETRVNNAPTGAVVCLHEGVYYDPDKQFHFTNAVMLKSYPGELAELRGSIRTKEEAAGFVLGDKGAEWPEGDGLRIDLSYGILDEPNYNKCPLGCDTYRTDPIHWDSDGGGIYANNISNRDPSGDTARAGTGVLMAGDTTNVIGTEVDGNYFHHCGQLPRNNHEHCMYLSHLRDGTVTDNLIYDSANRGIQNYPSPDNVVETGNLVVSGLNTGMSLNTPGSNMTLEHNVVVLHADKNFNVNSYMGGTNNTFRDNCTYLADGSSGVTGGLGVTVVNNVVADPKLVADWEAGTAKVTNATCAAKLPPGSRFLP